MNNHNSEINLKDLLTTIGALLGLVTVIGVIIKAFLSPNEAKVIAIAGYMVCLIIVAWFVFIKANGQKKWQMGSIIAFYLISVPYFIWVGTWTRVVLPEYTPSNLIKRFDFETGLPLGTSFGACDDIPLWYDHCHEAPDRLKIVNGGMGGEKSLESTIETSPDHAQVYTLRLPIDPPVFIDVLEANVYLIDPDMFTKISLAGHPVGEDYWVFSDLMPHKAGWLRLLTDLQSFKTGEGVAIDEVHIDLFVAQGNQRAEEQKILIDNLELYFPMANSFKTSP